MKRITLLTDFGTRDGYVAAMKGVIASIAPSAFVEDASHDIPPGDVLSAAQALSRYWHLYPAGTVHVVVVDPGVGTERAAIALAANGHFFVGPDNGVFSFIDDDQAVQLMIPIGASRTFHGRDVFAPAAARLSTGEALHQLGTAIDERLVLVKEQPKGNVGEVIAIDRFGNIITNLMQAADVEINGVEVMLQVAYGDVGEGELLALINSDGLLEIAVRNGSAAERLGISRGARVTLRL
jgi:S-adenosyl-L-methionine hydrolase (adenosine-forming)